MHKINNPVNLVNPLILSLLELKYLRSEKFGGILRPSRPRQIDSQSTVS
jgi:hypothetical protein